MSSTYTLVDTFNDAVISRHRTVEAAARAELKHDRAVKRANGPTSYIPTAILADGKLVDENALYDARYAARGF